MTRRLTALLILLSAAILLLLGWRVFRDPVPATAQGPSQNVFVGTTNGLYASDGTEWWELVPFTSGTISALEIFGGYLYYGEDLQILRTDGVDHEAVHTSFDLISSLEVCGTELWASTLDGLLLSSSDGETWGTEYDTDSVPILDVEVDEDGNGAMGTEDGKIYPIANCVIGAPIIVADTDITSIGIDHDDEGDVIVYAGGAGTTGNVWQVDGATAFQVITASTISGIVLPDSFVLEWQPILGDRLSHPYGLGDGTIETWRTDVNDIAPGAGTDQIDVTDYVAVTEVLYDEYNGRWYVVAQSPLGSEGAVYYGDMSGFTDVFHGEMPASILIGTIGETPLSTPTPDAPLVDTPTPTPTPTRTPTPAVRMLFSSLDSTPTRKPILQIGFARATAATPGGIPPTSTPTPTATATPAICIEPTPLPTVVGTIAPSLPSTGSSIPVSDTFICHDQPETNFGNSSTLSMNSDCSILSKYSVAAALPVGALIEEARLHLFVVAQPSTELGDTVFFVNRVKAGAGNATWTELGATWRDRNPSAAWSVAGARGAGSDYVPTPIGYMTINGSQTGWVEIAIDPSAVQSWLDAPETNFGFVVWSDTTKHNLRLTSSEWADRGFRPYLSIDMTMPE